MKFEILSREKARKMLSGPAHPCILKKFPLYCKLKLYDHKHNRIYGGNPLEKIKPAPLHRLGDDPDAGGQAAQFAGESGLPELFRRRQ